MFVGHVNDMPKIDMTPGGAKGAAKQVAVGPEQGWEDYVMRIMTLDVEGNSPQHSHDWPHINYVISGTGVLMCQPMWNIASPTQAVRIWSLSVLSQPEAKLNKKK